MIGKKFSMPNRRSSVQLTRPLPALRIVVVGCAAFGWTGQGDAATVEVTTVSLTFVPADVTIESGDSIHFTGLFGGSHTVAEVDDNTATSWNGGFHSPASASEFTQVFNSAGVFFYICEPHVFASMRGTITVTAAQVTFEWVTVGNPANAPDPLNQGSIPGIGSVNNPYRIAKNEVTNDQYAEFLNAVAATDTNGLYNASMGSNVRGGITLGGTCGNTYCVKANMGNKPVNYVSFFDAMRFVNWLHNGQLVGAQDASTTEEGVYTISDGLSETRAGDAQFFIPTENEWYKAAYHQPSASGGDADDYWLYPTASNSVPTLATADATGDISNPGANVANYNLGADWNGQLGNLTTVGTAGPLSESFYGTSDQGGNVWEWSQTVVSGSVRVLRGGSWSSIESGLRSSLQYGFGPTVEVGNIGFRVASPFFCGPADVNCDGDVDLEDHAAMQNAFTGPQ